jgi:hypothetical protein
MLGGKTLVYLPTAPGKALEIKLRMKQISEVDKKPLK